MTTPQAHATVRIADTTEPIGCSPYDHDNLLPSISACAQICAKAAAGELPRRQPFMAMAVHMRMIGWGTEQSWRVRGFQFHGNWRLVIPSDVSVSVDTGAYSGPAYMAHDIVEELIWRSKPRVERPKDRQSKIDKAKFAVRPATPQEIEDWIAGKATAKTPAEAASERAESADKRAELAEKRVANLEQQLIDAGLLKPSPPKTPSPATKPIVDPASKGKP